MNIATQQVITLKEYASKPLSEKDFPEALGLLLKQSYSDKVTVDFPHAGNGKTWTLTAQSWVGFIPLSPEVAIRIDPKVPIYNLFGMLEYAYNLGEFKLLANWNHCDSLEELYERLAEILAKRIADRTRRGLYRTYIPKTERLNCIRGRLDLPHQIRHPWETRLKCHYQEQTADIEDNQILLWTLHQIRRQGICSERVLPTVRRAYRALQGTVALTPYSSHHCRRRTYNRLNDDYQVLHTLCRFFLDYSGPSLDAGDRRMIPFLVDMNTLFEEFVAAWLKAHSCELLEPHGLRLKAQEKVTLSNHHALHFRIDLVLEDIATGTTRYVLDTKYKDPEHLKMPDVHQVMAYAETKGTKEAVLIYPAKLGQMFDVCPNQIRVRGLSFDIEGHLDAGGRDFLSQLLWSAETTWRGQATDIAV
jgi:5-methylcytosine-specific restriction enzyme subunit McrC